jgi:Spy/CpxP family protein refolding chaperone
MTRQVDIQTHREQGRGRRAFWALLIFAVAVVVTASARSSHRRHDAPRPGEHRSAEHTPERIEQLLAADSWWLKRADIEEEQRQQIAALLKGSLPELRVLTTERDEVIKDLIEALGEEELDTERIEELRRQAAEIATRALDESFDDMVGLGDILTPEQRRALVEHWRNRS